MQWMWPHHRYGNFMQQKREYQTKSLFNENISTMSGIAWFYNDVWFFVDLLKWRSEMTLGGDAWPWKLKSNLDFFVTQRKRGDQGWEAHWFRGLINWGFQEKFSFIKSLPPWWECIVFLASRLVPSKKMSTLKWVRPFCLCVHHLSRQHHQCSTWHEWMT